MVLKSTGSLAQFFALSVQFYVVGSYSHAPDTGLRYPEESSGYFELKGPFRPQTEVGGNFQVCRKRLMSIRSDSAFIQGLSAGSTGRKFGTQAPEKATTCVQVPG